MNLHKLIFTNNACYKSGKKHTIKGIMVHSTGANNPWLKRYVGPDDGLLGKNQYNNHWNQDKPDGREVCVHGFIGKLADGSVASYQTLPWDIVGWHSGSGSLGYAKNANNTGYIGFEVCEDGLTDASYFSAVYKEAVELCVYLCKQYGLIEQNIICHSEGHKLGIASNHADVMHWFPKHGKSMDTFRADVKALLGNGVETSPPAEDTGNTQYPEKLTSGFYRVRKIWEDKNSQIGAYMVLSNARKQADANPDYYVFSNDGMSIYPTAETGVDKAQETYAIYTVVKGDSLWAIAQKHLGSGTRYTEIKSLNGLTSNIIYSGQKLKLPK